MIFADKRRARSTALILKILPFYSAINAKRAYLPMIFIMRFAAVSSARTAQTTGNEKPTGITATTAARLLSATAINGRIDTMSKEFVVNSYETYIINRLKELEFKNGLQKEQIDLLKADLAEVENMKKIMRTYFILDSYSSGQKYIDHSYDSNSKLVQPIADFIGLKEKEESEGEEDE